MLFHEMVTPTLSLSKIYEKSGDRKKYIQKSEKNMGKDENTYAIKKVLKNQILTKFTSILDIICGFTQRCEKLLM